MRIRETLKDWFANKKAVEQYGDSVNALAAQIKSFSGDTAGAAAINFDAQNRDLQKRLRATYNSDGANADDRKRAAQGLVDLAQLREQTITTAKLNDLTSARSVILGDLANSQDRIDLAVSRGSKSELQGLADQSAANAARIESLEKIADALRSHCRDIEQPAGQGKCRRVAHLAREAAGSRPTSSPTLSTTPARA